MNRQLSILAIAGLAGLTTACATHKLEPPTGFAQVGERTKRATTMKGPKNVGLNVRVWDNVKGGSLAFWAEDLVDKLGARGYRLQGQNPVTSKNGVAGTRFDFEYTTHDGADKFYSAVLFASDEHRVVLQLAGDAEFASTQRSALNDIAGSTTVRGCKRFGSLCKSAQPSALRTPPPPTVAKPPGS